MLGASAALLGVGVGVLLLVVFSLDRPWVKGRVQALLFANSGLEVDYGAVRVSVAQGVEVVDLMVRSPLPLRGVAPELFRAGRLRVGLADAWNVAVDVERVELTVVVDEHGATSFDAIPSSKPKSPPTPLSHLPAELVAGLSVVDAIHLTELTLALVRTEAGKAIERTTLGGVSLALTRKPGAAETFELGLGRPEAPRELELERRRLDAKEPPRGFGAGSLRAMLHAELAPKRIKARLALSLGEHSLAPELARDTALEVEIEGSFNPNARRSTLRLVRADFSQGVATLQGELELPDTLPPVVRRAAGHVDVAKLLERVPSELLPVSAREGTLDLHVEELSLDRPLNTAVIALEGDLEEVKLGLEDGSLALSRARVSLGARPEGAELGVDGKLTLERIDVESSGQRLRGEGVVLTLAGKGTSGSAFTGSTELRFNVLDAQGTSPLALREGRLSALLRDFAVREGAPFGDLTLDAEIASLESRALPRATARALKLRAHSPLALTGPLALDAELGAARLRVFGDGGRALVDAPARAALKLENAVFDRVAPKRSRGAAEVRLALGTLDAEVSLKKTVETLEFELGAHGTLGLLEALLPEPLGRRAPFSEMTFALGSRGRLARLLSREPELREHTTLTLSRPAYGAFAANALSVELRSTGTPDRHEARAELRTEGLSVAGIALGDDTLTLDAAFDGTRPALRVTANGHGALRGEHHASFTVDRALRSLDYDVRSSLSELSPLAPLAGEIPVLRGLDLTELALRVESQGTLSGLFAEAKSPRALRLSEDALAHASAESELSISATGVRWAEGDRAFQVPSATLRVALRREPGALTADSELVVDEATLGLGRRRLGVSGLRDRTRATLRGGFVEGELEVSERMAVREVHQNFARTYPVGDVKLSIDARRDSRGVIRVQKLSLENAAGGTLLSARGGLELGALERRLSLETSLRQDLARLSKRREELLGHGSAALELTVASPDLRVFHNQATLRLEGASVKLPKHEVELTGIDGEVPIAADLVLSPRGVELLRAIQVNPYAMLRFADQHPLLQRRSFLSIERVETPFVSVAPFVANLQIEQNLLSLSQLELGLRGGTVTGNGLFEYDPKGSRVHADVRASGIQSSRGERFDGNAALVLDMGDHSIEGRADILRIGARHLLDLLDVQDPGRADPALNRIRSALDLGYPESVKISFRHGFANAGVSFGGFARLLKVGEVRGIPVGPLMNRVVSSFSREEP